MGVCALCDGITEEYGINVCPNCNIAKGKKNMSSNKDKKYPVVYEDITIETTDGNQLTFNPIHVVHILYKDHKGEKGWRRIVPFPRSNEFITTQHHIENQWIIHGVDLDKREVQSFAMMDIEEWHPAISPCGNYFLITTKGPHYATYTKGNIPSQNELEERKEGQATESQSL